VRQPEFIRSRLPENIEGRALAWYAAGIVALLALLGWGLAQLAPPPPPKRVVMTTGEQDGAYHQYAARYRDLLAKYKVELVLLPSSGAAHNLERLRSGEGDVDVGLVQGRPGQGRRRPALETLGSVFYEPIWVFYRGQATVERISELRGRRIAVGAPGSGTHALGLSVARDNGLDEPPTELVQTAACTPPMR